MRLTSHLLTLSLAAKALATGILLPLYVYPSQNYSDGAANWKPVFNAISDPNAPGVPWIVVIDPDSGPGAASAGPGYDVNYSNGTAQLNALGQTHPVTVVGYVHLQLQPGSPATQPEQAVKDNITLWSTWQTDAQSGADIRVGGIFFDEATTDNLTYLGDLTSFARATLGAGITVVCNPGQKPSIEAMYTVCDVVLDLEQPWATYNPSQLASNGPSDAGYRSQTAPVVYSFVGTGGDGSTASVDTLTTELQAIKSYGSGWTYFTSSNQYHSVTLGPADVVTFAETFYQVFGGS